MESNTAQIRLGVFNTEQNRLFDLLLEKIHQWSSKDSEVIKRQWRRLIELGYVLDSEIPLAQDRPFFGQARTKEVLVKRLCHPDLDLNLDLPGKAVVARAFLFAKIEFLRTALIALNAIEPNQAERINDSIDKELRLAIYTLLGQEVLLSLLPGGNDVAVKAAKQLITLWDNASLAIADFCPMLEAVWSSRANAFPTMGSLVGASEYFELVAKGCPNSFLHFFTRDDVEEAEAAAFQEFLFELTYEELGYVRSEMEQRGVSVASPTWCSQLLNRVLRTNSQDAIGCYNEFGRRMRAAKSRALNNRPGPRKTAEAYMMTFLLQQQAL